MHADIADPALPERLAPVVEALGLLRELHRRRNARPAEETVRDLLEATRAHAGFVLRPWGEVGLDDGIERGVVALDPLCEGARIRSAAAPSGVATAAPPPRPDVGAAALARRAPSAAARRAA